MRGLLNLAVLIVIGAMLANAIAKPQNTKTLLDGLAGFWKIGINGVLGKTS